MNTGYASYSDTVRIRRRRRPSGILHTLVVLGAWGVAAAVTLAVAADTKIGPVVFRLTKNHGLHAGDVYTLLIMSAFAAVVTIAVVVQFWFARRRSRFQR